jgi:superfamily I DNA/RNA helicase
MRTFNTTIVQKSTFQPSQEQIEIIEKVQTGNNVCIEAFAGAGKTKTLTLLAESVPNKNILMICFNKSIQLEAEKRFPSNVTCQTINSIAWRDIIRSSNSKLGKKLGSNFILDEIDTESVILTKEEEEKDIELRLRIRELVEGFCNSSFPTLFSYLNDVILIEENFSYLYELVGNYWKDITNPNSPTTITHSVYLKLFQLKNPRLDYDLILLDEFQDTNPVSLDIFLNQYLMYGKQIVCVGDRWQSIYAFRGATDAFGLLKKIDIPFSYKKLTTSYRFGDNIAKLANDLLYIAGETTKLVGGKTTTDSEINSTAYIYRNNINTLGELVNAAENNLKVKYIGDLKDLWSKGYHITSLLKDEKPKFPNRDLACYKNKKQLIAAAMRIQEVKTLLGLVQYINNNGGVYRFSKMIENILVKEDEKEDITISTVHRSKGLEFDKVYLGEDCFTIMENRSDVETLKDNQCLELIYIGVTRAIKEVVLPVEVQRIILQKEELREEWNNINKIKLEK